LRPTARRSKPDKKGSSESAGSVRLPDRLNPNELPELKQLAKKRSAKKPAKRPSTKLAKLPVTRHGRRRAKKPVQRQCETLLGLGREKRRRQGRSSDANNNKSGTERLDALLLRRETDSGGKNRSRHARGSARGTVQDDRQRRYVGS
jgi:hypothetical protein